MPHMKQRSNIIWGGSITLTILLCAVAYAQSARPLSPRGSASAHVAGTWTNPGKQTYVAGGGNYEGGKWIDVTYGSPVKRGRPLFVAGPDYGKAVLLDTPIWRAGADVSTRLKTEVPVKFGTTVIPPGEYSLFVDLKENTGPSSSRAGARSRNTIRTTSRSCGGRTATRPTRTWSA